MDDVPEPRRVIGFHKVSKFVNDDIIDDIHRCANVNKKVDHVMEKK
jgi:hypothetical protein